LIGSLQALCARAGSSSRSGDSIKHEEASPPAGLFLSFYLLSTAYRMAWVTQAPRDGEPSVTFATKAAQNSATKRLNVNSSRQLQFIASSINPCVNPDQAKGFHAGHAD
jgi:hypothetical protein